MSEAEEKARFDRTITQIFTIIERENLTEIQAVGALAGALLMFASKAEDPEAAYKEVLEALAYSWEHVQKAPKPAIDASAPTDPAPTASDPDKLPDIEG